MKFNFVGDLLDLREGLETAAELLGWELSAGGTPVAVKSIEGNRFSVKKINGGWAIQYSEKSMFFRALGFLNQQKEISEVAHFDTRGAQMDISQTNSVPKLSQWKEIFCRLALMGMNAFGMYMEDSFAVEGEPYIGYMRSRYSEEELRAIDDIAYSFGIEVYPKIEGLGHLSTILRWYPYDDIKEDESILLVGSEKAYEFIGRCIDAVTRPFRTNKIGIASDEAFSLGRGKSLTESGVYRPAFDLAGEHLRRLFKMCQDRGLEFYTSADMFMMAANKDKKTVFEKIYSTDTPMPEEIKAAANIPVNYILWDYSHLDQNVYENLIERYREFGNPKMFLAGIWNWLGFGVDYDKTFATIVPAMRACKKYGIEEVYVSAWGNDTGSENFWSDLLLGWQLVAEHAFGDEPTEEEFAERFRACTGCVVDDFKELSYIDHLYGQRIGDGPDYTNFSRSLLWQDPLFGRFDYYIKEDIYSPHFAKVAEALEVAEKRNGEYGKYLGTRALCARVMELKAALGYHIHKAYHAGDKAALADILNNVLPELKARIIRLHARHRELWYEIYKPLGWEVEDLRYGALAARIDSVGFRLRSYLDSEIDSIPELEEERLSIDGKDEMPRAYNYLNTVTVSYVDPAQ